MVERLGGRVVGLVGGPMGWWLGECVLAVGWSGGQVVRWVGSLAGGLSGRWVVGLGGRSGGGSGRWVVGWSDRWVGRFGGRQLAVRWSGGHTKSQPPTIPRSALKVVW